ncbi:MAG: 16S rRNA (cytosine(1402)-N(4))-methyltransferase RsmH [Oligoflexus sp.]
MNPSSPHITVLKNELVEALNLKAGDIAVDCTAGYGGHTAELIRLVGPSGKVFAFDRDVNAIQFLRNRFSEEIRSGSLELIQAPFSSLSEYLINIGEVQGICADLGVSSPQLDEAERGFSLQYDGPLDMRMGPDIKRSAADIVNHADKHELVSIFRQFGEEPKAPFIADAIIKRRATQAFTRTLDLADVISSAVYYKTKSRRHPATRSFQALRIAVNQELSEAETLCRKAFDLLKINGRLAIISFHSLEDRVVKQHFRRLAEPAPNLHKLRDIPFLPEHLAEAQSPYAKIIKPFPRLPSESEINDNPRSRSAKLRVLEKIRNRPSHPGDSHEG